MKKETIIAELENILGFIIGEDFGNKKTIEALQEAIEIVRGAKK